MLKLDNSSRPRFVEDCLYIINLCKLNYLFLLFFLIYLFFLQRLQKLQRKKSQTKILCTIKILIRQ